MKIKFIIAILIVAIMQTIFVGCDVDYYAGVRPVDYPNTKWTCEEVDMYFAVLDDGVAFGELKDKHGNTMEFTLRWAAGLPSVDVLNPNEIDMYFQAECDFGKHKFIMSNIYIYTSDFTHIPEQLTFYRSDI